MPPCGHVDGGRHTTVSSPHVATPTSMASLGWRWRMARGEISCALPQAMGALALVAAALLSRPEALRAQWRPT